MCLSCISPGEVGNTMTYLRKQKNEVMGSELKKMMLDEIQRVFICFNPKYKIL